jgi:hypothetical protein
VIHTGHAERPSWVFASFDVRHASISGSTMCDAVRPRPGVEAREFVCSGTPVFLPERGLVLGVVEGGRLVRFDLFGDDEGQTLLEDAEALHGPWDLSPSGHLVCARTKSGGVVLDVRTGGRLWASSDRNGGSWLYSPSQRDVLLTWKGETDSSRSRIIVRFDEGTARETPVSWDYDTGLLVPLRSGGFVAATSDSESVVELDADFRVVRQLLPVPGR